MYSNLKVDPIDYRSEVYEAKKGGRELFVAHRDPTMPFDAAEEVLDCMTVFIEFSAEKEGITAS